MRGRHVLYILLALMLVASACADDAGETTTTTGAAATTTTTATSTTQAEEPEETEEPEDPCDLWYTDFSNGTLTRYDLCASECETTTVVGVSAQYVDIGFGSVWVTDCIGGQLIRVDVTTDEVTGRINLPGGCPSDMVFSNSSIWLTMPGMPGLLEIDPYTGDLISIISTDDSPISMQVGSLWVGFMGMVSWVTGVVHAVGETDLTTLGSQSTTVEGKVNDLDGDPLFTSVVADPDEITESLTRIYSITADGPMKLLADLAGYYKRVVAWGDHFIAIAPNNDNVYVGMLEGPGAYNIPVTAPYAIKKGRDGNGGGNGGPPGPPGPPNPLVPPGVPGVPVVLGNHACDIWFWPDGGYETLDPQGNCVCDWTPESSLTDLVAATPTRVDAEEQYAATIATTDFPMMAATGGPPQGPTCNSFGWGLQNSGRTILNVHSTWEEDGSPVPDLEVQWYLADGDWFHVVGSGFTDEDGVVEFSDLPALLDEIDGAPGPGSVVTIGQAPIEHGVANLTNACEGEADV